MSNSKDHNNPNYHDSTKRQPHHRDGSGEVVQDVKINLQNEEAPRNGNDSTSELAEVEDIIASDAQSLLPSVPPLLSPPPPAEPPPQRRTHHRASVAALLPRTPPHPLPFGPFSMPAAGFVPPPMFMPPPPPLPPPHFQFFPYGQPYMPYSYTQIPNYNYPPSPWLTGPFDCFSDPKNCCLTCCCPCVTFGQITEILNEGQTPWWEHAAGYLVLESITLSVGTFLYACPYRLKMRTKFLLSGKLIWDFLFTFFCTRVSLCQQYRQLCRLGLDVPLGWEANREKMRLTAMENMYRMHNRQITPPDIELGMYR